ncbi:MAG: hypothetical protein ACOC1P_01880 [Minisyncoccales bacterium]
MAICRQSNCNNEVPHPKFFCEKCRKELIQRGSFADRIKEECEKEEERKSGIK